MQSDSYKFLTEFINNSQYVQCAKDAHHSWIKIKEEQGWSFGPNRDPANKKNPFMVPFDQLPEKQQAANNLTPYAVANF